MTSGIVYVSNASISDYVLAVTFGCLVGMAELIARYRDAPLQALKTLPAGIYVGFNGIASGAALALVRVFDWNFGQTGEGKRVIQVLVAGFGALALFRTSLFIVRAGDQDVGVGPSSFLQVMLGAADRSVDRIRARARAQSVRRVMEDVAFDRAHTALPAYCLALMQNVSPEDQADLGKDVDALRAANMDDLAKALNLGLALMNVVGPTVLAAAVTSLGSVIQQAGSGASGAAGGPVTGGEKALPDAPLPPVPPMPSKPPNVAEEQN